MSEVLEVVGLVLIVAGLWVALGLWAALLASGASVLLVARGVEMRAQARRRRRGSEVA